MEILTEFLRIRKFSKADAGSVFEAMACPEICQMYGNAFTSMENVTDYIDVLLNEYRSQKYKTLAIAEKDTDRLTGAITVDINPRFARAEYSYWIIKERRNLGYATQALQAMNRHLFTVQQINRVEALTNSPASERVLIKCGMQYEGTLRQYYRISGVFRDMKVYSLLRNEFFSFNDP